MFSEELADVAASSLRQFLDTCANTTFLLVKLVDDPTGQLETGLHASAGTLRAGSSIDVLAFDTHRIDKSQARRLAAELGRERATASQGIDQVRKRIARGRHYAIAISKRDVGSSAFSKRVSIGRARNSDVVLRHASVSKFHAWFEHCEGDQLFVADAGTTNGTYLNGLQLEVRQLSEVRPGDLLRFGTIEGMLCTPEAIWKALGARR